VRSGSKDLFLVHLWGKALKMTVSLIRGFEFNGLNIEGSPFVAVNFRRNSA